MKDQIINCHMCEDPTCAYDERVEFDGMTLCYECLHEYTTECGHCGNREWKDKWNTMREEEGVPLYTCHTCTQPH